MAALTIQEHRHLLQCLQRLYATRSLEEFPRTVLLVLAELVGAEIHSYNEVNLRDGRIRGLVLPDEHCAEELAARMQPHLAEHPLITRFERDGDGMPSAISDFLSPYAWHRTALYNEFFRPLGLEDQMAVGLHSDPQWIFAIAFSRNRRSFSPRDRLLLETVRPHWCQAHANAAAFSQLRREVASRSALFEDMNSAVLLVNENATITFCSERAQCLLCFYFGASTRTLPDELRRWLAQDESASSLASKAFAALHVKRGARTLTVRRGATIEGATLLLLEGAERAPNTGESVLGLTPRQNEVLRLLTCGASNAQIAAELCLSVHTVKRHLEAIYQKLGVESRSAAAHYMRQMTQDERFDTKRKSK